MGDPQNGWLIIRETPIKMNDLGVPLFQETPMRCCSASVNQNASLVYRSRTHLCFAHNDTTSQQALQYQGALTDHHTCQ